jgi:hypothetical protein
MERWSVIAAMEALRQPKRKVKGRQNQVVVTV